MIAKNNKNCIICGTAYSYCPNCGADRKKPSWYAIFDSENCNNIYEILTNYRDGVYTAEVAYEKIKTCDLSKLNDEGFNSGAKKQIEEILAYKEKENFVEPTVEIVEEVSEPESEAVVVEEPVKEENTKPVEEKKEQKKQDNFKHENKFNGNKFNKNYK